MSVKNANELLDACRRSTETPLGGPFDQLDDLLSRGGVLPDDWSAAPGDGVQRVLEAWAVWRIGQCDFPFGLSPEERALLAALDIHVSAEPALAIPVRCDR